MPTIAFIGVRISWLIVARKADFACAARSAASRAASTASRAATRSVMSRTTRLIISSPPISAAETVTSTGISVPSTCSATSSMRAWKTAGSPVCPYRSSAAS